MQEENIKLSNDLEEKIAHINYLETSINELSLTHEIDISSLK